MLEQAPRPIPGLYFAGVWNFGSPFSATFLQSPFENRIVQQGRSFAHRAARRSPVAGQNPRFLLPTGGKRARAQDIARANAEAARLGVFAAAWQIRSELRRALTDAAIAARRAALLRTPAELQRNLVARLEQRRHSM